MPSKTGKTPASYYKSDVSVEQSTNVGFDSTTRSIISGDGAKSSISLSDDVLTVQPVTDDTTGAMLVKNQGGSNILAINTTDSKVCSKYIIRLFLYAFIGALENQGNTSFISLALKPSVLIKRFIKSVNLVANMFRKGISTVAAIIRIRKLK